MKNSMAFAMLAMVVFVGCRPVETTEQMTPPEQSVVNIPDCFDGYDGYRTRDASLYSASPITIYYVYDEKVDTLPWAKEQISRVVKEAQELFRAEMNRHGYGEKTFGITTDADGKVVIEDMPLPFANYDYEKQIIRAATNRTAGICLFFIGPSGFESDSGLGYYPHFRWNSVGYAYVPLLCCGSKTTTAHELGHAFGLAHDCSSEDMLMHAKSDNNQTKLSEENAAWLNRNPAFQEW